jgi:HrpA-like RNA helicase
MNRDNLLKEYNCVIIDEAHERQLNIDLLLLFLKEVVK